MKKFIFTCSFLIFAFAIISPVVYAAPETMSDDIKFEQLNPVSLDVVTNVITLDFESLIFKVVIIERSQFIDVLKAEPVSLQFISKNDLLSMHPEDLYCLSVNKISRLYEVINETKFKLNSDLTQNYTLVELCNVGYNPGPLRYTARHI